MTASFLGKYWKIIVTGMIFFTLGAIFGKTERVTYISCDEETLSTNKLVQQAATAGSVENLNIVTLDKIEFKFIDGSDYLVGKVTSKSRLTIKKTTLTVRYYDSETLGNLISSEDVSFSDEVVPGQEFDFAVKVEKAPMRQFWSEVEITSIETYQPEL